MLTLAMLLVAGCASSSHRPERDRSIEEYAPLKLGARWSYAVRYPGQEGEMTVSLVGMENQYFMDDRGGYFLHTPDGLRDKERFLIRYPLVPGNKWKSVVGPSAVEHLEIVSVGEPCEAAAGNFADCLVVMGRIRRDDTMSLEIRWTWVRGIGLAKLETTADLKGKGTLPQVTQSLKHYDLQAGATAAPSTPASAPSDAPGGEEEGAPETWESE
jgi:hypothetical protein